MMNLNFDAPRITHASPRRALAYAWRVIGLSLILVCGTAMAEPEPPGADFVVVVQPGDTLIGIAQRFLAVPAQWPLIQSANKLAQPDHLTPGTKLRIPVDLLASQALDAEVVGSADNLAITNAKGEKIARPTEGSLLSTNASGVATLKLADGTVLKLASNTQLALERLRRLNAAQRLETRILLNSGRLDFNVQPQGENRFTVKTKVGAAVVRGTTFGVETARDSGVLTDVIEGKVGVQGAAPASPQQEVSTGQGNRISPSGIASAPVALLPAPVLQYEAGQVHERTFTLVFPAVTGAAGYLYVMTHDPQGTELITTDRVNKPEIPFQNLDEGIYYLRIRAFDENGIPGFPAVTGIAVAPGAISSR